MIAASMYIHGAWGSPMIAACVYIHGAWGSPMIAASMYIHGAWGSSMAFSFPILCLMSCALRDLWSFLEPKVTQIPHLHALWFLQWLVSN